MLAALIVASVFAPPFELGWRAPASCPDATHARGTIDKLLEGHAPPEDRRVAADVVIERVDAGFRASVRIDDGTSVGERELEGKSCEEVADAAALIVAMAVDPRIGGALPPPPDEPIPPPPADTTSTTVGPSADTEPPTDTTTTTRPPAADSTTRSRPRVRPKRPPPKGLVRAAGGVGYGAVPTASGVVMIAIAIAGKHWRVELDADVWTPRRRDSPTNPSIGVRVLGWSLGVRGCGSPLARKLEIPLCAGIRAGALHGKGVGDLQSRKQVSPWLSATFGVGVWGWITPRFALALDLDGQVAFMTPAFVTQPSEFIVRAPPGGLRAVFGPVVKFP